MSSTTKVLTEFQQLRAETAREEFRYVVPDFRLNKAFGELDSLTQEQKDKVEFLCNECCWVGCRDRNHALMYNIKLSAEKISAKPALTTSVTHRVPTPSRWGTMFTTASRRRWKIRVYRHQDIPGCLYADGIFHRALKIEGITGPGQCAGTGKKREGDFLLYYMTKPEYQLHVRESHLSGQYFARPVLMNRTTAATGRMTPGRTPRAAIGKAWADQ